MAPMDLETASRRIIIHSDIRESHSFMGRVLHWQLTGDITDHLLEQNTDDLIDCLERLHHGIRHGEDGAGIEIDVALSMSLIITSSWEQYRGWLLSGHLPMQFLERFANALQDIGYGWTRLLDGHPTTLAQAIAERHEEMVESDPADDDLTEEQAAS